MLRARGITWPGGIMSEQEMAYESGSTSGRLLRAREILNLRLNASLVTLSACNTSAERIADHDW